MNPARTIPPSGILPLTGQGRALIAINVVFLVLPILAVAGRIWSRRLKKAPLGWDDYCIMGALIIWIGQVGFNLWATVNGAVGYHIQVVPPESIVVILKQLAVSQFTYAIFFFLVRLSICFLFMRIFLQRWLKVTVFVAIAIQVCWVLFVIFSQVGICVPFAYNWDLTIPGGHCDNGAKLNLYIANAIWTIVYDFCLICLPQPIIWQLQMPIGARTMLSFIFALGLLDVVISIIRIIFVARDNLADLTDADYLPQVWTILEQAIAIIVACLPTLRPALTHAFPCISSFASTLRGKSKFRSRATMQSGTTILGTNNGQISGFKHSKLNSMRTYREIDEDDGMPMGLVSGQPSTHQSAVAISNPDSYVGREPPAAGAIHVTRDITVELDS